MLPAILFVVSFVVYVVEGRTLESEKDIELPCHISKYDLNGDFMVSVEEFMTATQGFTRVDPATLFQRLDTNADHILGIEEFKQLDPSLVETGIFDHCRHLRCWFLCFG